MNLSFILRTAKLKIMKTRLVIFTAILLCMVQFSEAQIKFGIRGGINSARVKLKDYTNIDYDLAYAKGDPGYHFGVMSQIKLLGIFVQPEVLFTVAKNDIQVTDHLNSTPPEAGKQKFYKLDVPVIVGYKLGPLKLQAGPVGTFMLGSKSPLLDKYNMEQDFKGATFGFQAGVGLELSSLLVDVKYEGNLSRLGDGVNIGGERFNFDQRMSQWIFSIGYLF
jgi:hypothetical protein